MPWGAIIGAGASILGGLMGSKSQKSATNAQLAANRESLASQERLAREAMAQQDRYYNDQQASQYPRQRAGNAALQQLTDLYGLGDIYAAPTDGSLGGGAPFYPGAPVSAPQQGYGGGVFNPYDFYSNYGGNQGDYRNYLTQMATGGAGRGGLMGYSRPPEMY